MGLEFQIFSDWAGPIPFAEYVNGYRVNYEVIFWETTMSFHGWLDVSGDLRLRHAMVTVEGRAWVVRFRFCISLCNHLSQFGFGVGI